MSDEHYPLSDKDVRTVALMCASVLGADPIWREMRAANESTDDLQEATADRMLDILDSIKITQWARRIHRQRRYAGVRDEASS